MFLARCRRMSVSGNSIAFAQSNSAIKKLQTSTTCLLSLVMQISGFVASRVVINCFSNYVNLQSSRKVDDALDIWLNGSRFYCFYKAQYLFLISIDYFIFFRHSRSEQTMLFSEKHSLFASAFFLIQLSFSPTVSIKDMEEMVTQSNNK